MLGSCPLSRIDSQQGDSIQNSDSRGGSVIANSLTGIARSDVAYNEQCRQMI